MSSESGELGEPSEYELRVVRVLRATQVPETQRKGEEELMALEEQGGFALSLLRVALRECPPGQEYVRQFAGVHLRAVVNRRWDRLAKQARPPLLGEPEKQAVRALLPRGLAVPERPVRNALAHVLACVGCWDWPSQWPNLLTELLAAVKSGRPVLVQGALRCLSLFAQSGQLGGEQTPRLVPLVGPAMLQLYQSRDEAAHPYSLRVKALPITAVCVSSLIMLRATFKKQADALLNKLVPAWLPHFIAALSRKDSRDQASSVTE